MAIRVALFGDSHLDRNRRFEETIAIHDRVLAEIRDERPDVIIHLGDFFDGQTSPVERAAGDQIAMAAGEIADSIWIAGNHGNPADTAALANLRTRHRLWAPVRPKIIAPGPGLLIACLPHLPSRELQDVDQVLADFALQLRGHRGPTLLAAHVTLEGAQLSNGETMAHQGSAFSPAALLGTGAQIVVSGHIHLPQSFAAGRAWHAGSIRRTDFGERNDEKGWLLVEYDSASVARVSFRPLAQREMVKIEAQLTDDGWAHVEHHRPCPGEFEWPSVAPDADIWILLHYPSNRAAEFRSMRDEAERRYPGARIDGRVIPVVERRSVEFTAAKGLVESFRAWRHAEGDYLPPAPGVVEKLQELEAAIPGFGAGPDGPSAMAGEGLVLDELEFCGINGVVEPIRVPYADMNGIICVAGPNGAGKTTLFEASLGALTREFAFYGGNICARTKGAARIAQSFRMAGHTYQSTLRVSPKGTMEAALVRDGVALNDPKLLREFDREIGSAVGSKEILELTVFARQAGPDGKAGFFELSPADRTARIIELTGSQRYETATKFAGERRKGMDLPIREAQATIDTIVRQLVALDDVEGQAGEIHRGLRSQLKARNVHLEAQAIELTAADEAVTAAMRAEAEIAALPGGADAARRELAEKLAKRSETRTKWLQLSDDLKVQDAMTAKRPQIEMAARDVQVIGDQMLAARLASAAGEDELERLQGRQQESAALAADIGGKERARDELLAAARLAREQTLAELRQAVQAAEGAARLAEQAIRAAAQDPDAAKAEAALKAAARALETARQRRDETAARASLIDRVPCSPAQMGHTEDPACDACSFGEQCELLAGARRDREAVIDLEAHVATLAEQVLAAQHDATETTAAAGQRAAEATRTADQAQQAALRATRELHEAETRPAPISSEAQVLARDIAGLQQELASVQVDPGAVAAVRTGISVARDRAAVAERDLTAARDLAARLPLVEAAEKRALEIQRERSDIEAAGLKLAAECEELERRLAGLAEQERQLATAREATAAAKNRRQQVETQRGDLLAAVAAVRGQIEQLEALRPQVDGGRATLALLSQDQAEWALVEKACGKTGLQALAVDEAGPEIADLVNQLLIECHGPRWTFGLATQVAKADGKGVKDRFEPIVFDCGEPRDRVSGGEGAILDVAVRLALAIFNGRHSGRRYETIWLDEAAQAVGVEHSSTYIRMLRLAMELGGFRQVLIISHQETVQELCDWLIRLENRAVKSIECLTAGQPGASSREAVAA